MEIVKYCNDGPNYKPIFTEVLTDSTLRCDSFKNSVVDYDV